MLPGNVEVQMDVNAAIQNQLHNIETRTGKTLAQLHAELSKSGLQKHGELRDFAKIEFGIGHGDANTLTHSFLKADGASLAQEKGNDLGAIVDEIYSAGKEAMRPWHYALMERIYTFGEFEISPKKGYLSLRRKKQFVMIGPGTKSRLDIGINAKGLPAHDQLLIQPAGSMCPYQIRITNPDQITESLYEWMKTAYDQAG